jgi:hypothetical protein
MGGREGGRQRYDAPFYIPANILPLPSIHLDQEQEMFDKQEEEGGSDIQRTAEGA